MADKAIDDILEKCRSASLFLQEDPLGVNDTNIFGDSPLHMVCRWGDAEAVATLLTAGSNVDAIGEKGQTPLFCTGSMQVVELLLAAGADAAIVDQFGHTAETFLRSVGQETAANHIAARTKRQ